MTKFEVVTFDEFVKRLPPLSFIFPETSFFELKHSFERHTITLLGGVDNLETTSYLLNRLIKEVVNAGNNCLYIAPNYKIDMLSQAVDLFQDGVAGHLYWFADDNEELTYDFSKEDLINSITENSISLVIIDSLTDFSKNFFREKSNRHIRIGKTFDLLKSVQSRYPVSVLITHTTIPEKTAIPTSDSIKEGLVYCLSQVILLISNIGKNKRSITNIRNFVHEYSPTAYYDLSEENGSTSWALK